MNKKKLYLRQNDLDSKTCYYFLAYLAVVHFQTIYFAQSDLPEPEKKCYRVSWLSNYDTHRQNAIYMPFFRHFIQFSIGLLYKDVTQSDRIQQCDVTVSSEAFGCFRHVFGKFKIYTFETLINKLLLTKKFRKTFCMQKWPPNFIFSSQKKCANSQLQIQDIFV